VAADPNLVKLSKFLGQFLNGASKLGVTALPVLNLYNQAQAEGVDFWHLILTDPEMSARLVETMRKHAGKIPDNVVAGLRLALQAHAEAKAIEKVRTLHPLHPTPPRRPTTASEADV
jgi:ABC-type sulfate transport system permease subunit